MSASEIIMDLLFIMSRDEPSRYRYLTGLPFKKGIELVLGRRTSERRQSHVPCLLERRQRNRRRYPDITSQLQANGWAVVRRRLT